MVVTLTAMVWCILNMWKNICMLLQMSVVCDLPKLNIVENSYPEIHDIITLTF